jgi:hypothetical protein
MTETMKNAVSVKELLEVQVLVGDGNSSIVDMSGFDTALVLVGIGNIGGTPDSLKVTVQESDVANFGSGITTMEGGDETTVTADNLYQFQVRRTKRYMRVNYNFTAGTSPDAETYAVALATNWAKPFNIV